MKRPPAARAIVHIKRLSAGEARVDVSHDERGNCVVVGGAQPNDDEFEGYAVWLWRITAPMHYSGQPLFMQRLGVLGAQG